MKKSLIAGGSFAVLAFAIGAVSLFSPLNPHVAAMQTTRTSMEAVSQLSAAELATLKSTVAADPQALLREASEAADLTKITRAEFDALAKPGVVMQYGDSNGNTSGKVEGKTGNVAGTGTVDTSSVPTTPTVNGDSTKAGGGASTGTVSSAAIDSRIDSARTFVKFTNAAGKLAVIAFDAHDTPVYTATF